jgi:hypothetical protein
MTARVPLEQEQAIIKAYLDGANADQAAALFGYSGRTALNILLRYGIKPRTNGEVHRQHKVNEHFFDEIDTEEKAYWLGFLTADGTISRGDRIKLTLQARDVGHLYKFVTALNSDQPVCMRDVSLKGKVYSTAFVQINCKRLVSALQQLGVGERKSLTVTACQSIPDELKHHYWRGLIDGDGCIKYDKTGKKWLIDLAGSYGIVSEFTEYIRKFVESRATARPYGKIYVVCFGGASVARKVISVLYENCNVYLDRKKLLADRVLATPVKRSFRTILA